MRRQPSAGANKIRIWIRTATLSGHPMFDYTSSSYLLTLANVYNLHELVFSSMALGLRGQILITQNHAIIFFLVSVWFIVLFTHLAKVILFGF
jgi:hypothetical protein